MDHRKSAIDSSGRHDHLVQFYVTPESLAETASHFIAAGLRKGETVIVISTPLHHSHFAKALAAGGVDLARFREEKRLIELDAVETLALFMSDGQPMWERFKATLGQVLEEAVARQGGVRAYGEMVDVLWQAGNLSAAIRLESYWNQLLASRQIPLFCAYRAHLLDDAADHSELEHILRTHTCMVPAHGELESAVSLAIEEVVGKAEAAALRPLIAATQTTGARLPWAEAAVFWLKNNLPERADVILSRARAKLDAASAAA